MNYVKDESTFIHGEDNMMDGKFRATNIYLGFCG
jgi:hypothetical protein